MTAPTHIAFGLLTAVGAFSVSRMGGVWRSLRYLMATPASAYADYRAASSEAILVFEGRRRDTREPVKGEALILHAKRPSTFWIVFEDRVLVCGENGDILPDKTRAGTFHRNANRSDTRRHALKRWAGLLLMLIAARVDAQDLVLTAPLETVQSVSVYAGSGGRVKQVRVKAGDRVMCGETPWLCWMRER